MAIRAHLLLLKLLELKALSLGVLVPLEQWISDMINRTLVEVADTVITRLEAAMVVNPLAWGSMIIIIMISKARTRLITPTQTIESHSIQITCRRQQITTHRIPTR
jgi:hypothetical protein